MATHQERSKRRVSLQKGSALVEGAFVMLAFLAIIFGIMDWSRMMLANNFVSYAAREGTRYAMVRGSSTTSPATTTTISNYVKSGAAVLDTSLITVNTTWAPNNSPGSSVTVQVQYSFQSIAPYIPSMTLKSASTMIISQ